MTETKTSKKMHAYKWPSPRALHTSEYLQRSCRKFQAFFSGIEGIPCPSPLWRMISSWLFPFQTWNISPTLVAILGQCWQIFINTPYMESLETLPTFSFRIVDFLGHTVCGGPPNSWKGSCFSVPSCPPPQIPDLQKLSQLKWISNMPRTVKV